MIPGTSKKVPTTSPQSRAAELQHGLEPKNIVICCDGTGNEFGDRNSNVIKLYKTLIRNPTQVAYYHPGVGTMGARNALSSIGKWWTKTIGLAFGYGISDNIADAYQFLMRTYTPGDVVFVFGFSRGAYTARALCGMLHIVGLLYEDNEALIPYAIRMIKGKHVDFGVAAAFKKTFSRECKPHFVGVWDTVSSLGWVYNAVHFPFTNATNNPDLSIVRHAISIDERRAFFRQNSFGSPNNDGQEISEVWFAGVHSDVGGSYPESESQLSQIALRWMICEAGRAGLMVDSGRAADVLGARPPYVRPDSRTKNLHESLRGAWWIAELWPKLIRKQSPDGTWHRSLRVNLGRRRWIPEGSMFHESVQQRLADAGLYAPTNLPEQRFFSSDMCTKDVGF
jgi:uncharacterized protein (DUF2235 family)